MAGDDFLDEARRTGWRGWELHRRTLNEGDVYVVFASAHPPSADLLRLRNVVPELRDVPPAQLVARIDPATNRLHLGTRESRECVRLEGVARGNGLNVVVIDRSSVGYLPVCVTGTGERLALLVDEDDEAATALAKEMITAAVKVIDETN